MPDKAIEVLLDEKRNFPPPKTFKKSAHAKKREHLHFRPEESAGVLGQGRQGVGMVQALEKGAGMGFSLGQMVHRREAQCLLQLSRSARQKRAEKQSGHHLGRGAGRRARAHLSGRVAGGQQVRQCFEEARRQKRRPRLPLHGHGAGVGYRHARLQPHRRPPQRCVRRFQRRGAARSDQ